jgi:hypothetical protein
VSVQKDIQGYAPFGIQEEAAMNPFLNTWLSCVTQHMIRMGVSVYDEGVKDVRRQTAGSCRPLPPLRWAHGAGAGIRNRVGRLALRQLRRADRSGHTRPSSKEPGPRRGREVVCRSWEIPSQLDTARAHNGGPRRPSSIVPTTNSRARMGRWSVRFRLEKDKSVVPLNHARAQERDR